MTGTTNGHRNLLGAALLILISWVLPQQLLAQPPVGPPPNRDGRGLGNNPGDREVFFEAMREAFRELTPNRELMELLWIEKVRDEIGLSSEKHQEIEKLLSEGFNSIMALRGEAASPRRNDKPPENSNEKNTNTPDEKNTPKTTENNSEKNSDTAKLDKEAWTAKILAIQRPIDEKILNMLADPAVANLDRLIGIYTQSRKFRSAANAAVASRIGLAGQDFEDFRRARNEIWHRLMDQNRDKMSGLIREGNRKKIAQLFEEAEQKLDSELSTRLTSQQKSSLEKLKGEPFELPRRGSEFRGRGPRGPGENRPNNGPGNEQGAGERTDDGRGDDRKGDSRGGEPTEESSRENGANGNEKRHNDECCKNDNCPTYSNCEACR